MGAGGEGREGEGAPKTLVKTLFRAYLGSLSLPLPPSQPPYVELSQVQDPDRHLCHSLGCAKFASPWPPEKKKKIITSTKVNSTLWGT